MKIGDSVRLKVSGKTLGTITDILNGVVRVRTLREDMFFSEQALEVIT